jgi:hypothetical protein
MAETYKHYTVCVCIHVQYKLQLRTSDTYDRLVCTVRVCLHSELQTLKISLETATFEVVSKVSKLGSVTVLGRILAEEEGSLGIKSTGVRSTLQYLTK